MHTDMSLYTCLCASIGMDMDTCMHLHMDSYKFVHVYVHVQGHVYGHAHSHGRVHGHVWKHAHGHVHKRVHGLVNCEPWHHGPCIDQEYCHLADIRMSVHMSIHMPKHISIHMSTHMSAHMSIPCKTLHSSGH